MELCGTPFWDWNLTWNTTNPDFTSCFQETVLAWIPLGFIWLFGIWDIFHCLKKSIQHCIIPWNVLNIAKVAITGLLALNQIIIIIQQYLQNQNGYVVYPVSVLTPGLRVVTFGFVLFLIIFCKNHGIRSSGPQFLFWLLLGTCEGFAFRTTVEAVQSDKVQNILVIAVLNLIFYPLVLASFFLNCWSDAGIVLPASSEDDAELLKKSVSPEADASFLSELLFCWFDGFAWKGYRKPLDNHDLWELNKEDRSSFLIPLFRQKWDKLVKKDKKSPRVSIAYADNDVHFQNGRGMEHRNGKTSSEYSVLPCIIRMFGPTLIFSAILKLLQDLLTFASPEILKLLISFVDGTDTSGGELWKGYLFAILLFVTSMLRTIFLNQYFQRMMLVGMRIRTTIVNIIYRKSLVISSSARKESTVGEIVNLMSVDAHRFQELTVYVNMLWSAPLQILLSIYFLWGILGPSVLSGLVVMILLIPVNAYIASKIKKFQIQQMKQKDLRAKLMNEILNGIKVLKLYAWEPSFTAQVMEIRNKEIQILRQQAYLRSLTTLLWNCAPFLVAVASFGTFVLSDPVNNILDAQTAFVALSLFNILRFPLSVLPMVISTMVQANVSLKRINKFMNAEEIDSTAVTHDTTEKDPIVIHDGFFSWDPLSEAQTLSNINLRVNKGSLVAICGSVGSGKSSLLSAILGEVLKVSGRVNTHGSIAYVAQQAWIQNATVRDNILFGFPFDAERYDRVIDCCALRPDLEILPAGDRTEIGEKGINLSGGQKQRISLARAAYHSRDVYLLDDPLSAVDSHVGKHIFEKLLGPQGMLKKKTRLLVTHSVTHLPQMDHIVVVKDGRISEAGSYRQLLHRKGAFADFLIQHLGEEDEDEQEGESQIQQDLENAIGVKLERRLSQKQRVSESDSVEATPRRRIRNLSSFSQESSIEEECRSNGSPTRKISGKSSDKERRSPIPEEEKLIKMETAEIGEVKLTIYAHYLKAVGWVLAFLSTLGYISYHALSVASNFWLSYWSNSNQVREANNTTDSPPNDQGMYLGIYGALGIGQGFGILLSSLVFAVGGLKASNSLHFQMLERVLHAPMSFFDTNPLGRIVNRFLKDVDVCDNTLPLNFETFLNCLFNVVAVLAVISYVTPVFMAVILPIGIIYLFIQRFYVATSRELKRLESTSRSPIYSHFNETLTGCTTIRAYQVQTRFTKESEHKVDINQMAYFPSVVANRWLAVRLETLGNFFILFAALFAVLQRDSLSPGVVGLSISYALNVTQVLNWLVRMSSAVETDIVAVERIEEYHNIEQEAPWENASRKPLEKWPMKGEIKFEKYETRYRKGLDLVLRGVTCQINPSEKVGVVGRTGAGKSSLTLALFRIIEATNGSIIIDDEKISNLGLQDLRSRLTIIPQDPVLFSGTLRINLDPFSHYTDEVVWHSLELAHLKSFVRGLDAGLQYQVAEGGENLSIGQRQLICLARALLRKSKVLILDEATAAVDLETDALIQETIKTEFKDSTIITIAHRLNTIMDYNRVMVLDKGEIREFDSPQNLLNNKLSIFYGMAKDAGLV